jgi:hypothetical protein
MKSIFRQLVLAAGLSALLGTGAQAQLAVPAGGTVNVSNGSTVGMACTLLDVQGNLLVNAGQVLGAGGVAIASGGSLNGGSGLVSLSGNWSNSGSFTAGSGTVVITDGCAVGPITISGNTVFNNLTLSSTGGRSFVVPAGSHLTVNGTLTLQGAPGQPIVLQSSSGDTAVISLGPNANVVRDNAIVSANVQIGALPATVPTLQEWGLALLALLVAVAVPLQRRFKLKPGALRA